MKRPANENLREAMRARQLARKAMLGNIGPFYDNWQNNPDQLSDEEREMSLQEYLSACCEDIEGFILREWQWDGEMQKAIGKLE
jgi:hypothetical protein